MTFQPSIQALIGPNTPHNNANVQCAVDWLAAQAYIFGPHPTLSANYLAIQNVNSGVEGVAVNSSTFLGGSAFHEYPVGLDGDGKVYITSLFDLLGQINQTTLVQIQQATTLTFVQGGLSAINATDGTRWVLGTMLGNQVALSKYACYKATDLSIWTPGIVPFGNLQARGCSGLIDTGIGWVLTGPGGSGDLQQLDLHKVIVNTGVQSHTVVGSLVPTDIDAAWTQIYGIGICPDQDGNLLVQVQGQTGAANLIYIAKISATDASVIWKTHVSGTAWGVGSNQMMQYSSINFHRFYYYYNQGGGVGLGITILNTSTGAIVSSYTTGLSHFIGFSGQASNDTLGAILLDGSLSAGSGGPTLRNSTPSTFAGWSMLYVAEGAPFPPASAGRKFLAELGPVRTA